MCFPGGTGLPDPVGGIGEVLMNLMDWLLGIFGMLAVIAFVISGIQYLLAAGDERQAETAKRNMKYSIIGIAVALSAYIIIDAISCMFGSGGFFIC